MITLRSDDLLVRVDPDHGGELLDLIDLRSGRQLLGRPPFGSEPALAGDLDEERWTRSYRGGWQSVLPNAGNACDSATGHHGFHGRASNDPWRLLDHDEEHARMSWAGHGLDVEKLVALEDGAVAVRYRISAAQGAPLVAVEHLSVGLELLEPEVRIDLPAGCAYELSEQDGPLSPPADATRFPTVRLLDGSTERANRWPIGEPRSRLYVVSDLPAGWALIANEARDQGLAMAWDAEWYRHCWVWHENRVSGGAWRGAAEMLVVEPATVPHSLGLSVAEAAGHVRTIEPGVVAEPWIVVRPVSGVAPVSSVGRDGRLLR